MGTRHLTVVIKHNKIKLAQYGQWDGYFNGQGVNFVEFIKDNLTTSYGLDKFNENIDLLKEIREETLQSYIKQWEELNKNKEFYLPFESTLPQFCRDTGTNILKIIQHLDKWEFGKKKYPVYICKDFSWCEYIYCINLDNNEVYMLTNNDFTGTGQKACPLVDETYKGFKCWYSSKIKDLPSIKTIQKYNKSINLD